MRYVPALDGLRALAVIGVLISHYTLGESLNFLVNYVPWGHIGVRLFFVLSGFLITSILISCRELAEKKGFSPWLLLRQFYFRRFLRIFPVFYATLFFAYVFDVGHIKEVFIYHLLYLSNTSSALTGTLVGFPPLIDPTTAHFWSLAVEEQFYLFWPFLVLFIPKKELSILLIFMIILAPLLRLFWFAAGYQQMYSYLPMCVDTLGFGAFLAFYQSGMYQALLRRAIVLKYIFYFSLTILITFIICYAMDIYYRPQVIGMDFFEGIIYAFLINFIIIRKCPTINVILENGILRYIGTISYGMYILHAFTPHLFYGLFSIEKKSNLAMFFVMTAMTILIAAMSYKFYEQPLNNLKKYFPYRYS